MQSQAPDVSTYLEEAPADRQAALKRLRLLCQELLTGYDETIEYGMPCYKRNGRMEIAFASQKQYISLYVLKQEAVNDHRAALAGCKIGKGCIRFSHPDRINFDVIKSLLRQTQLSPSRPC